MTLLGPTLFQLRVVNNVYRSCMYFKSDAFQQAGLMSKIMKKQFNRNQSKRNEFGLLPLGIVPKTTASVPAKRLNYRRAKSLNKVFMQHIADFMSSRFLCEKTGDLLVEVNRVETSPDFQFINAFYINRNESDPVELKKKLDDMGGIIRHEMSQLKVVGYVPKINFVLDQKYIKMLEVEKLLKVVDLGESDTEDANAESLDWVAEDIDIPVSYCVYGLNHPEITERIKHRKRLAKKPKQASIEEPKSASTPTSDVLTSNTSEIKRFLKQQEKL